MPPVDTRPLVPAQRQAPRGSTPIALQHLTARPSSARVWDWLLHGKDNYPVDAALARALLDTAGFLRDTAVINRAYAEHATAALVGRSIRQFIDLGCGLPAYPSLHKTAAALLPDGTGVTIAYVDHDPIVTAHTSALLTPHPPHRAVHLCADLARPKDILTSPALLDVLDLTQPVGVLAHAVLHELPDQDAHAALHGFARGLAPGSALSLTHLTADFSPAAMSRVAGLCRTAVLTTFFRTRTQVASLLDDWELVDPGLTETAHEHSDGRTAAHPVAASAAYAAIALNA
ncbi:SAM-dependent methyltransferase [Streptomyces ardesiacus]|uniref:SAM-dependent methyltransferase n=1 Tax=Streptomyces ardesiacus TaxID=285564 RepID=UPI003654ADBD